MNASELLRYRLASQRISHPELTTPGQVARWMGIVQAQEYAGAKWSVALRTPNATEATIEQAIADRSLIRTWSLRGTLQFMAPEDVHWVGDLIRPRMLASQIKNHVRQGLDEKEAVAGLRILPNFIQSPIGRTELKQQLAQAGFASHDLRFTHLLVRAALEGMLCLGPRQGKEFTYTLLDEWIPRKHTKTREEALADWAARYFTSHGPATIQDFAWWAGLTMTEARQGLESVKHTLASETMDGATYWMAASLPVSSQEDSVYLLSGFDEFLLGYKDRKETLPPTAVPLVVGTSNGLFRPTIVKNGKVIGIWKSTQTKQEVSVEATFFEDTETSISWRVEQYRKYRGI